MKILFIAARFSYPPLRGDQVRAYHQLRLLGRKHRITLLSFADRNMSSKALQAMTACCEHIITLPLSRFQMAAGLLQRVFSAYPFQVAMHQTAAMKNGVQKLLTTQTYDVVHVQLARMAPYLENLATVPRFIDLIDALSLNMRRRYQHDRSPLRYVAYLEWKRMYQYEQRICQTFERCTVVSPVDYEAIGAFPNLFINPNGVDLNKFSFQSNEREPNSLVFTGNMGYFPNENAVLWFVQQVLPLIQKTIPAIKFYIVGARPTERVKKLAAQNPAISVTGFVENLPAYLHRASVAVAPMQAGSGIQNKVIEAMACGIPVVATFNALKAIEGIHNEHVLIADNAVMFADQVVRLLKDKRLANYLATNARRLIKEKYTWENSVAHLEQIYYSMQK